MKIPFKMPLKTFIYLLLPFMTTANQGFAEEYRWTGTWETVFLTDTQYWDYIYKTRMDVAACWNPNFTNTLTSDDTLIFDQHLGSQYYTVESSNDWDTIQHVGSFNFNSDEKYEIVISKNNTLSIHGEGVINSTAVKHTFRIDDKSTLNFLNSSKADQTSPSFIEYLATDGSTLSFKDGSSAGTATIVGSSRSSIEFSDNTNAGFFENRADIKIENKSKLAFNNSSKGGRANILITGDSELILSAEESEDEYSSCKQAIVQILNQSTLTVKKHSSIGSLDLDESSKIILGDNNLTLGYSNTRNSLKGEICGNVNSQVIKLGKEILTLNNSSPSFKGKIVVKDGTVLLKQNLLCNLDVYNSESVVEFQNNSKCEGKILLTIDQGKVLFKDTSSADSANISVTNWGELAFIDNSSGGKDTSVNLKEHAKLSFNNVNKKNTSGSPQTDATSLTDLKDSELPVEELGQNDSNHEQPIGKNDNKKYTLGSLKAYETSIIDLKDCELTVGELELLDDNILGQLIGKSNSKLIKTGLGNLKIDGDNTEFKGDVNIEMGKVDFQGKLGGSVIVNESCSLIFREGEGSIAKDLTLNKGAIVDLNTQKESDKNHLEIANQTNAEDIEKRTTSLPTLQVSGNYTQKEGSEYHFVIMSETDAKGKGRCSKIEVKGKADLGERISKIVVIGENYLLCAPYEILTAERGIKGEFIEPDDCPYPNAKFSAKISDSGKEVTLRVVPHLAKHDLNANQKVIAEQIDQIDDRNVKYIHSVEKLVALDKHAIPDALDDLSGSQYANLVIANKRSTDQFIRRIYTPLRFISTDHDCQELCFNQYKAWADLEGGKSFQSGAQGYDLTDYHFTAGIQRSVNDWLTECCPLSDYIPCSWLTGWTFGLAANYSIQDYQFKQGGDAHLNNVKGAFYGLMTKSMFYFLFDIVLGNASGELKRPIEFTNHKEKGHGKIDLFQATFYGELGFNNIYYCEIGIQPFVGIEAGYYNLSDIKEHNDKAFDLKIDAQKKNLITSYLGTHLYHYMDECCSWGFAADIAWKHLFGYDNDVHEQFVHFGEKFPISGPKADLNGIEARLIVFKEFNDLWSINAEFSGEKWANYSNFYLSAGVIFKW